MDMGSPWWYPGEPDHENTSNFACMVTPDFNIRSCEDSASLMPICQVNV